MRIGVDAMGGDNAPEAIIEGITLALREGLDADIVLYGDDIFLQRQFLAKKDIPDRVSIVHCSDNISMEEKPVAAIRKKKDSPIVKACNDLKTGRLDAFVSAGSTGALLAAGTLIAGRVKGVKRPALTSVYPTKKGFAVLSDIGANVDCTPKNIHQFAIMATLYSREILGVEKPKVALMNIGTEENKGTEVYKEAYTLLKGDTKLNFAGNLESRELLQGEVDVVVCDGFTGNITLKLVEGVSSTLLSMIKEVMLSSTKSKIGAFLLKDSMMGLKKSMSSSTFGGAPFLGTKYPVVKAHGSSNGIAIKNAIKYAEKYAKSNLIDELEKWVKRQSNDAENLNDEVSKKED